MNQTLRHYMFQFFVYLDRYMYVLICHSMPLSSDPVCWRSCERCQGYYGAVFATYEVILWDIETLYAVAEGRSECRTGTTREAVCSTPTQTGGCQQNSGRQLATAGALASLTTSRPRCQAVAILEIKLFTVSLSSCQLSCRIVSGIVTNMQWFYNTTRKHLISQ